MITVDVLTEPDRVAAAVAPGRTRILAALSPPASASAIAERVGMSRQLVNHHLRVLERHGLVELVEERRRGNVTERVLRPAAASFVVSPEVLGEAAPDPSAAWDRLSAGYLVALGSRLVTEVGRLMRGAASARLRVATLGLDVEVRFASTADRAAFADELTAAVASLVSRYHSDEGRPHRVVLAVHPIPPPQEEQP